MRLREQDVRGIMKAAHAVFGPDCVVRLFGSRTDDAKKGGDIDLHITVANPAQGDLTHESRFRQQLEKEIGERKIDLILMPAGSAPSTIEKIALATGIILR